MRRHLLVLALLLLGSLTSREVWAQSAQYGVAVPFTFSAGLLDTDRLAYYEPSPPQVFGGFRLVAMPEIRLGSHWYGYGAVQLRLTPYFYQDAYNDVRQIKCSTLQAFLGYSRTWDRAALNLKIGKLSSAFGSFPLHYDDMVNPFIDQPLPYNYLLLQPSGGAENYGLTPVTLYGLPAAAADFSWGRLDTRFQLTNSNPYNPIQFFKPDQHPQWTVGGGYTIVQGFRVGMSAYRGTWLSGSLVNLVRPGKSVSDYPATGVGVDVQWARGRWSLGGEWQRFQFDFPVVQNAPTLTFGYLEAKMIVHPRWYVAFRPNYQTDNHAVINGVQSPTTVFPDRQYYEFVIGFRPDHLQLLKVGYEWAKVDNGVVNHNNVLGIQLVTTFNGISKAFK